MDIPSYLLGKSKGGGGTPPVLIEKNITASGTYNASTDEADGYSKVYVDVPASGIEDYFTSTITYGTADASGVMKMLKKIPSTTTVSGTSLDYAFNWYCASTLPYLDTSAVTSFNFTFNGCKYVNEIPLYNTSNALSMRYMFSNCQKITTIPLLDTSKVTNMEWMFNSCIKLTTLPAIDTSKVTNMGRMFSSCTSLVTAPQLNTSSVTKTADMFNGCSSLKTLIQYDTSNVTDMDSMCRNCPALEDIPLLDTSKVTRMAFFVSNPMYLTDTSFDNLLQMCANTASNYSQNKKLTQVCSNNLPTTYDSRIQALPHYQDFIDAGWTIR